MLVRGATPKNLHQTLGETIMSTFYIPRPLVTRWSKISDFFRPLFLFFIIIAWLNISRASLALARVARHSGAATWCNAFAFSATCPRPPSSGYWVRNGHEKTQKKTPPERRTTLWSCLVVALVATLWWVWCGTQEKSKIKPFLFLHCFWVWRYEKGKEEGSICFSRTHTHSQTCRVEIIVKMGELLAFFTFFFCCDFFLSE